MKALSRVLLTLAVILCCFGTTLLLTACGNKSNGNDLLKTYVKDGTLATKVELNDELDTSKVVLVLQLVNKSTYEIEHDNLEIDDSEVNTSKAGTYNLMISYNVKIGDNLSFTGTHTETITVRYEADAVMIMGMSSDLLTDYNKYSGERENDHEEFVVKGEKSTITVGSDNAFNFRINANGIDENGEAIENLEVFRTIVTVKHNNQVLEGEELAQYVAIDTTTTTLQFTEVANGETFEVTVAAANPADGYDVPAFTATLNVVDGFNVYNARELSVYDNSEIHKDWYADMKAAAGLTDVYPNRIILQNNINITKDDIPYQFFWDANNAEQLAIINDVKSRTDGKLDITGTLRDSDDYGIYQRELKDGEQFEFIGNYFSIDAKNFPLIKMEFTSAGNKTVYGNTMITSHMALFLNKAVTAVTKKTDVTYKNMSFIGNSNKSSDTEKSGGLLMMKATRVNFNAENTINQNFYIGYFVRCTFDYDNNGIDDECYDDQGLTGETVIEKCKGYDAYQDLLYSWGGNHIVIRDCDFENCGGPAIIADSVHESSNATYMYTHSPKYLSKLDIINSTIISEAVGTEPWYNNYAANYLQNITANNDKLFINRNGVNAVLPDSKMTMISDTLTTNQNETYLFVNLQVLMKGRTENISTPVNMGGSYTRFFETAEDYEAYYDEDETNDPIIYGLDFGDNNYYGDESNLAKLAMNQEATAIFQNAGNGAFISSSFGATTATKEYASFVLGQTNTILMAGVLSQLSAYSQIQNVTVDSTYASADYALAYNLSARVKYLLEQIKDISFTATEVQSIVGAFNNGASTYSVDRISIDATLDETAQNAALRAIIQSFEDDYSYTYDNGKDNQYLNLYLGFGMGVVLGLYQQA